jgi:cobyrinic acid a,c-diamide synthase
MGLFDGQNYHDEVGSTAQIAKLFQSPVFLVMDASTSARSMAAVALGFQHFDPELHLAGFILNFVAGQSHGDGVVSAVEQATGLPVLGYLPRVSSLNIPERHLGLIPTDEAGDWHQFIDFAAKHISENLDIDRLLEITRNSSGQGPEPQPSITLPHDPVNRSKFPPVIAVARDEAFNFTYPENLDLLLRAGADIEFFSPLHDSSLPQNATGVILCGGFPELYAKEISVNRQMCLSIQSFQRDNLPIYAECGGLMALTQSIVDYHGNEYPMYGLLPGRTVMTNQLHLGYRQAAAAGDSWLFHQGETIRGHEFHYSIWEGRPNELPFAYSLNPPDPQDSPIFEGVNLGRLWASYLHLSFWPKPELAERFVKCCSSTAEMTNNGYIQP